MEPLGVFGTGAELSVVGQVAMATDHGGRPSVPTGTAGQPLGGRTCRAGESDGGRDPEAAVEPLGEELHREVETSVNEDLRNTVSDWSLKYCIKYYELQHCALKHEGE